MGRTARTIASIRSYPDESDKGLCAGNLPIAERRLPAGGARPGEGAA
jgi:hypothetical protein